MGHGELGWADERWLCASSSHCVTFVEVSGGDGLRSGISVAVVVERVVQIRILREATAPIPKPQVIRFGTALATPGAAAADEEVKVCESRQKSEPSTLSGMARHGWGAGTGRGLKPQRYTLPSLLTSAHRAACPMMFSLPVPAGPPSLATKPPAPSPSQSSFGNPELVPTKRSSFESPLLQRVATGCVP